MSLFKIFKNGIIDENPALRLVLGCCPILAVTTSATNGLGMGVSTAVVLTGSNFVISLLRKFIPSKVRIPAYITIIAGFVTLVQMLLKAYLPSLNESLGIFIPLIVVNCIILARAETFASKNTVTSSVADGLGMGMGFTLALVVMGSIREILGNGSIFEIDFLKGAVNPSLAFILPPGGFLVYGILIGLVNKFSSVKVRTTGCSSCDGKCRKMFNTDEKESLT
ncbi:MAG: electron transport complex subunit E [Clostridiales bacterium]